MKLVLTTALSLAWLLSSSVLLARGWHATQSHRTTGSPKTQESELFYDDAKLRIDSSGDQTSVVVDIDTGKFTFIDHGLKQHSTITLDELVALRDRTIQEMKAQLPKLPPEVRKTVEERLKSLDDPAKAGAPALKSTGKKDKIAGFACDRFAWQAPDGSGEACIAKNPGVDMKGFSKASEKLSKRLVDLGGGGNATSLAILQLAEHGFPMETRRKIAFGTMDLETTTTVTALRAEDIPKTKFMPPPDYASEKFEDMMRRQQARPVQGSKPN